MDAAHGQVRNWRMETRELGAPMECETPDGTPVTLPASTLTQSVSERFCARCGWVEVRGCLGPIYFEVEHGAHRPAAPAPLPSTTTETSR